MKAQTRPDIAGTWDEIYVTKGEQRVSWFQPEPTVSLELIDELALPRDAPIIDVGGGASMLVDRLLAAGHSDLTVLDVSAQALRLAQDRLADAADEVHWLTGDLLEWEPRRRFTLWHDRAVFHFLTDLDQRDHYRELLGAGISAGGYLVMAAFALDGPERCSGLPVTRHGPRDLAVWLGPEFTPVATRREQHRTPGGAEQPFTWLVARHS